MTEPAQPERQAWQPLTPQGVALFATASLTRLLVVQMTAAAIVAACAIWFLNHCYSPVIVSSIEALPDDAEISKQQLRGFSGGLLAENKFLSIGVETAEQGFSGVGDVELKLKTDNVFLCSLFGCVDMGYPAGWMISLSRSSMEPWWGAWKPMILAGAGFGLIVKLLLSWAFMACIYCGIPKLISFYADRELNWRGAWKLSVAGQLTAALFVGFVLLLYGLRAIDFVGFLVFYSLHIVVALIYMFAAPFFLPILGGKKRAKDPFKQ